MVFHEAWTTPDGRFAARGRTAVVTVPPLSMVMVEAP